MSITTTVKGIQDIMRKDRGVDGDAQRISQLAWLLFLKVFDDREKELEMLNPGYVSPIPKKLRWRNWAQDDEGMTGEELLNFINNELFVQLKDLPNYQTDQKKMIIRGVFEDSFNYMKSGTLIRQVINKLNEIDFNKQSDRHLFNDIYETILKALQSAGNAGEFYTPRAVTEFIVQMVNPRLGEKIFDPACGTGGFLTSALNHIRNNDVKTAEDERLVQDSLNAVEKKQLPYLLCTTNLILHGIDTPIHVRHDNSLTRPLRDYGASDKVDVIVTNPPFGGIEEDGVETNFPKTLQTRETADLFLVLIMHLLKDGGRAGVVFPDGTLFGEGVKTTIKKKLLEECNLHTIIRLPNGVFSPYTGIKTNLLFFTKGEPTKDIWYFEHPYPEGVKNYNKTRPIDIKEFELEKQWWNNRMENEHAWKVETGKLIENNFNLDIPNPSKLRQSELLGSKDYLELIKKEEVQTNQLIGELEQLL